MVVIEKLGVDICQQSKSGGRGWQLSKSWAELDWSIFVTKKQCSESLDRGGKVHPNI